MNIYPAIDLKDGVCVRLTKGNFDSVKVYEKDPILQANKFFEQGSSWLHMVDLDGAKSGEMLQFDIIARITGSTKMSVQVGGGIRDAALIERLFDVGVKRVTIGSLAITDQTRVKDWLSMFGPERILLAFDVRINSNGVPILASQGWQHASAASLWEVLDAYKDSKIDTVMCTDIGRDGVMQGSNLKLYLDIKHRWPELAVIASGGVSDLEDLIALNTAGIDGAIVGKAIYEGRINLSDAIKRVQNAC